MLTNAQMAAFDPRPTAVSALLDRVAPVAAAGRDHYRMPRPDGPAADIGAVERQAQGRSPPGKPGLR